METFEAKDFGAEAGDEAESRMQTDLTAEVGISCRMMSWG